MTSTDSAMAGELAALREAFRGTLLEPGSEGYDEARTVFNERIDLSPRVIAQCADAGDVSAALAYAQKVGLPVSVRGGGRHVAGYATSDGGIVIDLSTMREVRVDPIKRTAQIQGGCRVADVLTASAEFGLAAVTGVAGHIGAAGLMLAGGIGWMSPRHGYASDNIVSLEVITATGQKLSVSAEENSELFWGMRGAGPNFGIVTSMEVHLHPVPASILAGDLIFDARHAPRVVEEIRALNEIPDDDLYLFLTYSRGGREAGLPPELDDQLLLTVSFAYLGLSELVERLLAPLRSIGALVDNVTATSYLDLILSQEDVYPAVRQFWGAEHVLDFDDSVVDVITELAEQITGESVIVAYPFRGRMAEERPGDGAFACRDLGWDVTTMAFWRDPQEDDLHIPWAEALEVQLRERQLVNRGVYPNMVSRLTPERLHEYFGDERYERLLRLKKTYDPANVFQRNSNVRPLPEARGSDG
jgi:FAD/FMN-containing dehydrogenase